MWVMVKPPRSGPSETALRLRSLPEGVPPRGENFSELLVKINDFFMEITLFCDIYLCIFDQIWMTIMKILTSKNIFQKYVVKGPWEQVLKNEKNREKF